MAENEGIPRTMLNDEAQAALARKLDAEAAAALAEAQVSRAEAAISEEALREQKASADAAEAVAREQIAAAIKIALINERQIATLRGDDEYRKVYQFRGPVNIGTVEKAMIHLNTWDAEDKKSDWEIHLFTPGGDMYAGLRFLDYLSLFKRTHKITTVSMGASMSMGAVLLQGGTWRRMGKESTVLIHKGSMTGWIDDSFDDVVDQLKFIEKKHNRIANLFAERAAQSAAKKPVTAAEIKRQWARKDWYLDSDECLARGIVDEVI